jgi:hypothetical protein
LRRPGNVHSAKGWEELLLPEIERQQRQGKEVFFRADAAFQAGVQGAARVGFIGRRRIEYRESSRLAILYIDRSSVPRHANGVGEDQFIFVGLGKLLRGDFVGSYGLAGS